MWIEMNLRSARPKAKITDVTDSIAVDELLEELARYERKAMPDNTRRAYRNDWNDFKTFCRRRGYHALPARPDTLALYITARAKTHRTTSIGRRLTVIGKLHGAAGKDNPVRDARVQRVWRGVLREKGQAVERKKPTVTADIRKMLAALPDTLAGDRDRALILFGFAGAMRRSELVALNVGDLELTDDGFVVQVRRSKTDQTAKGRRIGIPYGQHKETCPVKAMLKWLDKAGIDRGALFRKVNRHGQTEGTRLSGTSVALIVKRTLRASGCNPKHYSAHSLRAGLATAAAMAGVEERTIQQQTGHRNVMVLRSYIREASIFRNNAAKRVGL